MIGVLLLVARLLLDGPLASELVGGPWLVRVCERESRCPVGLVGLHEGDGWMQRSLGEGMSTRGHHGCVAAFTLEHVPGWYALSALKYEMPPWVLDVPLVSAVASVRRAKHWRCGATRACRAWRGW